MCANETSVYVFKTFLDNVFDLCDMFQWLSCIKIVHVMPINAILTKLFTVFVVLMCTDIKHQHIWVAWDTCYTLA